jgi:hypothetical protein
MGVWTLGALALLVLRPEPAWSHSVVFGQSKIQQQGGVVRYELAVNYDELAKRITLQTAGHSEGPPRAATDADREKALHDAQEGLESYLGSHVRIVVDGRGCKPTLKNSDVLRYGGELFAVMSLAYRCPGSPTGPYEVHYDLFFDSGSANEMTSHANLVDYELAGAVGRFVFEPGTERLTVSEPGSQRSSPGEPSPLASAWRFVTLGFEHILGGIDHLLFVVVLLLGARHITDVLKVTTAFTLAHSVTLALASLGWVSVPQSIVEPLIALTLAYVAVENIARGEVKHRLLVVFAFGLVHGFGFAEALGVTGPVDGRLVSSLFAFNTGIELGQILVVVLVWPLLLAARRLRWQRLVHLGASGLIVSLGLIWLVDRLVVL